MNDANATAPNAKRLLWAGFTAILATGVGFAIRGGILADWGRIFGFTGAQLGEINGSGFTGFCFGVIIGGVVADKIGYGKLVIAAFVLHLLSAVVTFSVTDTMGQQTAYNLLYLGTFIFALANGTLEAVANPLVATAFPQNRTHYLNILHASWPAGLALGGVAGAVLGEQWHWSWRMQLALFLVPTAVYGLMFLGQKMPKSEASAKGLSLGEMFKDVGLLGALVICVLVGLFLQNAVGPVLGSFLKTGFFATGTYTAIAWGVAGVLWLAVGGLTRGSVGHWLLFVLFATHALVGAVELGTDGWIQNITGNILTPATGKWLFVYTSLIMFSLRFCAHFIEKTLKLSPVGLLCVCAVTACVGLNLVSAANTTAMVMAALLVYAAGKTFFWPTMLAVASDRFPRTGAVAISIMGGIGMMSAGMIGSPGLGYFKDRYAGEQLQQANPAVYAQYAAASPSHFLPFIFPAATGLDGQKLGIVKQKVGDLKAAGARTGGGGGLPLDQLTPEEGAVAQADLKGDRLTLKTDSLLPGTMAVVYLLLLVYFKSRGGYKQVHIENT